METRLDWPVKKSVRLLALRYLRDAEEARARWRERSDAEALHDLRVALRRLRSCLRAYTPHFEESVQGRDRKRLKELAAATSECRDREVQLAKIRTLRTDSAEEAAARDWLEARTEAAMSKATTHVERAVEEGFPRERARLSRRLVHYRASLDPDRPDAPDLTTGEVAAGLATVLGAEVEARLASVRDARDQRVVHDARIAGKRLRYVLEPFRAALPLVPSVIEKLRALQDDLGDMRDVDTLADEIARILDRPIDPDDDVPELGLRALMLRLRKERDERFEQIRKTWLGSAGASLHEEVRAIGQQLRSRRLRGQEIRRRYVLTKMPALKRRNARSVRIDQGWLPGEMLRERIRREHARDHTRYVRTLRTGKGSARLQLDEELTKETYDSLWRLTKGRRIRKRRWIIAETDRTWHIDKFLDHDLILAEVQLPSDTAEVKIPAWLEPFVERDVTEDDAFSNYNLAK
jgi:CHAD domain-containing protein/CYTH domain-containing protein